MPYCPCGTSKSYAECCGKFISGQQFPASAEELMRSRYTAYQRREFDYIGDTMKPPASDQFDIDEAKKSELNINWIKLEVIKATHDTVEFHAHYQLDNRDYVIHEISDFKFIDGRWYYVNGAHSDHETNISKTGRNDPCTCGSGKKYKKCCG